MDIISHEWPPLPFIPPCGASSHAFAAKGSVPKRAGRSGRFLIGTSLFVLGLCASDKSHAATVHKTSSRKTYPVAASHPASSRTASMVGAPHPAHKTASLTARDSEMVQVSGARRAFRNSAAQHVADSTTRLSGETLVARGVVTLTDLPRVAPNLTIQSVNGTGTLSFYLRGIGLNDFTQNNIPSVMTYFDDVAYPLATMSSGQMFDVAGVDVAPGPVGFEHGMADTGGEVHIHTADPTNEWHGGVSEDIASYARSRTTLFVSGPIVTDKLSFRIAGQTQQGGGWQYNPSNGAHLGDANMGALRAKLKWTPDSKTEIMLTGHWTQDNSETTGLTPTVNFLPSRPVPTLGYRQTEWDYSPAFAKLLGRPNDLKPSEHNTFWGADLKMSRNLGYVTLSSISAFETERVGEYTDQDGSMWRTGDTYRNIVANAFSQEVRLKNSNANDRLQWVVGMLYNRTRMTQQAFFDFTEYTPTRGYMQETSFGQNQQTFTQFAHVAYRLPGNVTLFGGINHEADDRQLVGLATERFGISKLQFGNSGASANQFSGTLGVQWQVVRDLMTYFKVSKGFKPGGFTANNTVVRAQLDPFGPETVLSYEAGFKADIVPNRFRLNAAAFYNDYHGQQYLGIYVVPSYGPLGRFLNIPKSEIWGIEFNTEIHPFAHVYINQNFGYLRGKYQKFQSVNSAATNAQYQQLGIWDAIYNDYAGVDMGQPKLTLNGSADYRFNPLPKYEWEGGVDWMYRGAQAMVPGGLGSYQLPAYFLLGAHMTFHPVKGPWSATVYVTNLLNRQYFVTGAQSTTTYFWQPGPPRFIGGRMSLSW